MTAPRHRRRNASARDRIRTDDTRFRRAVLYPLSYSGNDVSLYTAMRPAAHAARTSVGFVPVWCIPDRFPP